MKGEVLKLPNRFRLPFRLTNAVWCLFALVMVNLYSSTLTSHITLRKMNSPPSDSIQVIDDGIFDYLVIGDGYGRELIMVWKFRMFDITLLCNMRFFHKNRVQQAGH